MKLAFFCLEFPPVNTTGNYRSAGFARYLLSRGEDVTVFTSTVESGEKTFGKKADYLLLQGLENAKIFRYGIRPFRIFWKSKLGNAIRIWWNTTDKIDRRWFYGSTKVEILQTLENEKPDFLYFSLPPFSVARMALKIHKKTGIPMIVDMRDAWSLWGTNPHQSILHYFKKKRFEYELFSKAHLILGVTPELIKDFREQHQKIRSEKFKVVYNGVDEFKKNRELTEKNEIYKIGYVGSFYYNPSSENNKWYKKIKKILQYEPRKEQWIYRSPYFFLNTLTELLNKNPSLRSKIKFEYVGSAPNWFLSMIKTLNLQDIFINHGFKSKQEVLTIQDSWDAILATSEKIQDGEHFCLPSKIFDAVQSRKEILAFVTNGSQKNFLKYYPQTTFFNPDELEKNCDKLEEVINKKDKKKSLPLEHFYSREKQSEIFYNLLNEHR